MGLAFLVLTCLLAAAAESSAQTSVDAQMNGWSKALGVECVHCHVLDNWSDASKPTFEFAQRMNRMLAALNAGPMKDAGEISCWTCHRGQSIPARLAREAWEKIRDAHAAEFEGRPNRAIAMSVYAASLGVNCSHCHETDRTLNTRGPKAMVAKMLPIFEEIPRHFDKATRMPQTQCYMCHHGQIKPERAPQ
jgi:hypothetical protein